MRNAAQPGTRRNMGTPGITDQEHANVPCPFPGKFPTAATQFRMGSGGIRPAIRYATLGLSGLSATVCRNGFLSRNPCHCRRVCLHWHWVAGTSRSVPGGQRCAAVGWLCASEPTDKAATTPAQTQVSVPRFRYGDRDRAGSRDTRHSSVAHPGGHRYQRFTQSGSGAMSSLGRPPGSGRPDPARRF